MAAPVIPTVLRVAKQEYKGDSTVRYSFGKDTLECPTGSPSLLSCMGVAAGMINPWTDATKNADGEWELPSYNCEVKGLTDEDPKNVSWTPGDYSEGVDNVLHDKEGTKIKEWDGFGLVEPGREVAWDPSVYPEVVQKIVQVPHMPGQPMKEMFARLKAVEPAIFEDKHSADVLKTLLPDWKKYCGYAKWAESFGVHTEKDAGEWMGQQMETVPAVYSTPRADTVTICVGIAKEKPKKPPPAAAIKDDDKKKGNKDLAPDPVVITEPEEPWMIPEAEGAEYDFLTHLYAKDQEGKVIAIFPYESHGTRKISFATVSFIPPKGTMSITPYASFKIRGVWKGRTIEWDPATENPSMKWFTDMSPEMRKELADPSLLLGEAAEEVSKIRYKKSKKHLPVMWPENSYEGNALKAKLWDQMNK